MSTLLLTYLFFDTVYEDWFISIVTAGKTVKQWDGKVQQGTFVIGPSERKLCPGD